MTQEINQLMDKLSNAFKKEMTEVLKFFNKSDKAINLEQNIHQKIMEIGRRTYEEAIPYLYGTGYEGNYFSFEGEKFVCHAKNKERQVHSIFGKIKLSRAIYYNNEIGSTIAPLDISMDIQNLKFSPMLRYWSCLLGAIAPFDEASSNLKTFSYQKISSNDVRRITENIAQEVIDEKSEGIISDSELLLQEKDDELKDENKIKINQNSNSKNIIFLEMDGCHVPTRKGWTECKTGLIFQKNESGKVINKRYFSTTRNVLYFQQQIKKLVESYCKDKEVSLVCIGDGAKWIWKMMDKIMPGHYYKILDWYHVSEKIWELTNIIYENDVDKKEIFVKESLDWAEKGNIETIISNLMQIKNKEEMKKFNQTIYDLIKYIENNKNMMRYESFREKGFDIGSGAIESANKYVIQRRLKLQGIQWDTNNADKMAHLRAEYINRQLEGFLGLKQAPGLEIAET